MGLLKFLGISRWGFSFLEFLDFLNCIYRWLFETLEILAMSMVSLKQCYDNLSTGFGNIWLLIFD